MTQIEGRCPKCNSKEGEYGVSEFQDDEIKQEVTCLNCGWTGYEWHKLVFSGYTDMGFLMNFKKEEVQHEEEVVGTSE